MAFPERLQARRGLRRVWLGAAAFCGEDHFNGIRSSRVERLLAVPKNAARTAVDVSIRGTRRLVYTIQASTRPGLTIYLVFR